MMLNENHQNLSCKFAEDLVSYLYDELGGLEKSRFEAHLKTCPFCPEEIGSFTAVRSSITDWRETEFLPLENPAIKIAFEQNNQFIENTTVTRPWLVVIRELFTLSPAWMTATATFAGLAICVGLVYALSSFLPFQGEKVIVQQDKPIPVTTPVREISNQNSKDSNSNSIEPKTGQSPTPALTKNNPGSRSPLKVTDNQPVKSTDSNIKKVSPVVNKSSTKAPANINKREKVPSLVGDEEEDDSLRLSDIFDEIGSR